MSDVDSDIISSRVPPRFTRLSQMRGSPAIVLIALSLSLFLFIFCIILYYFVFLLELNEAAAAKHLSHHIGEVHIVQHSSLSTNIFLSSTIYPSSSFSC